MIVLGTESIYTLFHDQKSKAQILFANTVHYMVQGIISIVSGTAVCFAVQAYAGYFRDRLPQQRDHRYFF